MATLIYADEAIADLWRLVDFLAETNLHAAYDTIDVIEDAVSILPKHPLIGRPAENGLRELVISRGRTGYVALYDYIEQFDLISILSIQPENAKNRNFQTKPFSRPFPDTCPPARRGRTVRRLHPSL